jgi:hypothetical protein
MWLMRLADNEATHAWQAGHGKTLHTKKRPNIYRRDDVRTLVLAIAYATRAAVLLLKLRARAIFGPAGPAY